MMNPMSAMAKAEMRAMVNADDPLMPPPFPMHAYQHDGVRRLQSWGYRGILADDMGLGKTRQAIAVISAVAPGKTLIICPAALKCNWQSEINTLLPNLRVQIIDHAADIFDATADITIVSYTLSIKIGDRLRPMRRKLLIADESHALKSPTSKCTKLALRLAAATPHVILLSGTPMARPRDLWPQIKMVAPNMFGKHMFPFQKQPNAYKPPPIDSPLMTFGDRYCAPKMKYGFGGRTFMDLGGSANLDELHAVLTSRCMIHRRKIDVLHDLPDKTREHIVIARDPLKFQVPDDAKFGYIAEQVRALSARKIEPVTRYLREIIIPALNDAPDKKLIIFCHHHALSDAVFQTLDDHKIQTVRYDGRTVKKQEALDAFKTAAQVAVMGIKSAGVGLNITYCDHVIFAEMLYGADEHLQAEDRCYRLGQRNNVLCQYLVYENSIDDLLWGLIQKKAKNASNVLHGVPKGLHATKRKREERSGEERSGEERSGEERSGEERSGEDPVDPDPDDADDDPQNSSS